MDLMTFVVTVFCQLDDGWPANVSASAAPADPADSEVLTIKCVREFLGTDTDTGLYQYFRRH